MHGARERLFSRDVAISVRNVTGSTPEISSTSSMVVNVKADNGVMTAATAAPPTPTVAAIAPTATPILNQRAFTLLRDAIANGFSEQNLLLERRLASHEQESVQSQWPQGIGPKSAAHPAIPPKSVKRLLLPLSRDYTDGEGTGSCFSMVSGSACISARRNSRAVSAVPSRNGATDVCLRFPNSSPVQVSPLDRIKKCIDVVLFLARGLSEVFWMILGLDPRLLALFVAFQTRIPASPSITISINDTIRLIDAFGQERRLQYATHRHFIVFKSFLAEEYKDTPSGPYISQGRYRLLDTKSHGLRSSIKIRGLGWCILVQGSRCPLFWRTSLQKRAMSVQVVVIEKIGCEMVIVMFAHAA